MEASITFKAVGKAIGKKTLLADLSFGVEKGSTFVILGENGSGKSVILKLLVGLIEKDTGSVYIHGQDISTRSLETRSLCGYMPQNINLDEDLTIFDNISIHGQLHGLTSAEAKKNTLHWAELLGLTQFLKQSPYNQEFGLKIKIYLPVHWFMIQKYYCWMSLQQEWTLIVGVQCGIFWINSIMIKQ